MTQYRIRLVEQLIEEDSGDFTVEAGTPELAAAILLQAHDTAREACRDLVILPDGQSRHIEPIDVVGNRVFCIQLDDKDNETGGEIEPDYGTLPSDAEAQDRPVLPKANPAPSTEPRP